MFKPREQGTSLARPAGRIEEVPERETVDQPQEGDGLPALRELAGHFDGHDPLVAEAAQVVGALGLHAAQALHQGGREGFDSRVPARAST